MYYLIYRNKTCSVQEFQKEYSIYDFEIAKLLKFTIFKYHEIMVEEFNATRTNLKHVLGNSGVLFQNEFDAERARDWIESQLLLKKITGSE